VVHGIYFFDLNIMRACFSNQINGNIRNPIAVDIKISRKSSDAVLNTFCMKGA
jgi:hypothetical protein